MRGVDAGAEHGAWGLNVLPVAREHVVVGNDGESLVFQDIFAEHWDIGQLRFHVCDFLCLGYVAVLRFGFPFIPASVGLWDIGTDFLVDDAHVFVQKGRGKLLIEVFNARKGFESLDAPASGFVDDDGQQLVLQVQAHVRQRYVHSGDEDCVLRDWPGRQEVVAGGVPWWGEEDGGGGDWLAVVVAGGDECGVATDAPFHEDFVDPELFIELWVLEQVVLDRIVVLELPE